MERTEEKPAIVVRCDALLSHFLLYLAILSLCLCVTIILSIPPTQ